MQERLTFEERRKQGDWSKKLGGIIGDVTQNFDVAFATERLSKDERAPGMESNHWTTEERKRGQRIYTAQERKQCKARQTIIGHKWSGSRRPERKQSKRKRTATGSGSNGVKKRAGKNDTNAN